MSAPRLVAANSIRIAVAVTVTLASLGWLAKAARSAASQRHRLVTVALHERGVPYRWGGTTPRGFDCSGFVQYVYQRAVRIRLPRTSYEQWRHGRRVSRSRLRPGDIVFFYPTSRGPDHVGIYIGGDRFIDAPHTGSSVGVRALASYPEYAGARAYVR